jgi:hypothetical protein
MPVYMNTVICAAAISGIVLSLIFNRLKVFDFMTAAAITLASVVTALVMPGVLNLIYSSGTAKDPMIEIFLAFLSIVIFIVLDLVFSSAIVRLLPRIRLKKKTAAEASAVTEETAAAAASVQDTDQTVSTEGEPSAENIRQESSEDTGEDINDAETGSLEPVTPEGAAPEPADLSVPEHGEVSFDENNLDGDSDMKIGSNYGDNYIEDIYLKFVGRNDDISEPMSNTEENEGFEADSDEKSVDSNEIIDKMGIENNNQDGGSMTIEECIDEAYRLREAGDAEGAILYYMYALDKQPQKDLTFWIILDICVLYKSLGQQDLALDILNGYYDIYGDEMDSSVKEEIIRNLTDTGA